MGLDIVSNKADFLAEENSLLRSVLLNELAFFHAPVKPCESLSMDCMRTHLRGILVHLTPGGDTATFRLANYSLFEENNLVWYSPSFHFNKAYKFCLAIHLGGIGAGNGTHVAICLHQMVGRFDSNLTWPFSLSEKLEIRLMRQETAKESKMAYFRSGVKSPQTLPRQISQGSGNQMTGLPVSKSRTRTTSESGYLSSPDALSGEIPMFNTLTPPLRPKSAKHSSPRISRNDATSSQ